jgi:hypothetical protein
VRNGVTEESDLCENNDQRCCEWNNKTERIENFNPHPIVLFSGGCAGSSAVLVMAHDIAELSKYPVLNCGGGYELLADIDSGFYGQDRTVLPAAVRAFVERADDANRTLLFKAEDRFLENTQTMALLVELNAKFAVLKRWNKIDVALCAVHDCFTAGFMPDTFGYKLDSNGQREDGCSFRGRGSNETAGSKKVFVDTSHLLENLRHLQRHASDNENFLERSGVEFQRLSFDDLFAFYSGTADDLVASSVAWTGLMEGYGVHSSFDVVYEYLKKSRGSFELPKTHSETIENFEAVKRVLENCEGPDCEGMLNMLRE